MSLENVKCLSHDCPLKEQCERYEPKSVANQLYGMFRFHEVDGETLCNEFIPKNDIKQKYNYEKNNSMAYEPMDASNKRL